MKDQFTTIGESGARDEFVNPIHMHYCSQSLSLPQSYYSYKVFIETWKYSENSENPLKIISLLNSNRKCGPKYIFCILF